MDSISKVLNDRFIENYVLPAVMHDNLGFLLLSQYFNEKVFISTDFYVSYIIFNSETDLSFFVDSVTSHK